MASFLSLGFAEEGASPSPRRLPIVFLSKYLQWLDWEPMAATAAELGFDGIDLTVRPGGHVLPERVEEDLPKVAKIVRSAGLEIPTISTGIVDLDSPYAEATIRTVSELGIPRYRWGWYSWSDDEQAPDLTRFNPSIERPSGLLVNVPARLDQLKKRVAALAALNEKYKVCAIYQNHSGVRVGASVWDLWVLLKDFDLRWVSADFDVAHATIEGGLGGWVNSTRLMAPFMTAMSIKDFKWGKNTKSRWEPLWCPLGEGMVNFPAYFAMIKEANFSGPVQLHTEYPLGGAESGAKKLRIDKSQVLAAIRKDLDTLKGWMRQGELI
jgi:sugar phosphate isomerase/epimerase